LLRPRGDHLFLLLILAYVAVIGLWPLLRLFSETFTSVPGQPFALLQEMWSSRSLQRALTNTVTASLGATLIVGVNSDASVRMLGKGDDRPINNEADRMALLAALESVDWVVCFGEQTPVALIEALRPDVLVKGGDYDMDKLPESALVRGWGGEALAIPFEHDRSTTALLKKVRAQG